MVAASRKVAVVSVRSGAVLRAHSSQQALVAKASQEYLSFDCLFPPSDRWMLQLADVKDRRRLKADAVGETTAWGDPAEQTLRVLQPAHQASQQQQDWPLAPFS